MHDDYCLGSKGGCHSDEVKYSNAKRCQTCQQYDQETSSYEGYHFYQGHGRGRTKFGRRHIVPIYPVFRSIGVQHFAPALIVEAPRRLAKTSLADIAMIQLLTRELIGRLLSALPRSACQIQMCQIE